MQSQDHASSDDIYKDEENPKSLVNICPTAVATRIKAIPEEIFLLKEADLAEKASAHDNERKLRAAFQLEYERALRTETKIDTTNIYRGIVTPSYWSKFVIANSYKLAYIIRPYSSVMADMEDLMRMGLDEMRTIMKKATVTKSGEFDHKLAQIKLSITKDLLDRTGRSASRHITIDQKSMVLTKDITEKKVDSLDDINARIKQLEEKEAPPQIEYKDVSSEQEV